MFGRLLCVGIGAKKFGIKTIPPAERPDRTQIVKQEQPGRYEGNNKGTLPLNEATLWES
jgi:hypothetical protein